jgi:hypothetical protein
LKTLYVGASVFAVALSVGEYSEGPPVAHTGGFGEPTCRQCHSDNPLNDAAGSLQLEGIPDSYEPNEQYRIAVALRSPGVRRAGFQLSARFASGPHAGTQAGGLSPVDERVEVISSGQHLVQYAQHTREGTFGEAPGITVWSVTWQAPSEGNESVAFHVAANASNDDDSEFGDFIYTHEAVSRPAGHD